MPALWKPWPPTVQTQRCLDKADNRKLLHFSPFICPFWNSVFLSFLSKFYFGPKQKADSSGHLYISDIQWNFLIIKLKNHSFQYNQPIIKFIILFQTNGEVAQARVFYSWTFFQVECFEQSKASSKKNILLWHPKETLLWGRGRRHFALRNSFSGSSVASCVTCSDLTGSLRQYRYPFWEPEDAPAPKQGKG